MTDGVSIIGLGIKLPGANNKIEFYDMLKNKKSGIGIVPSDRWNADKYTDKGHIPAKICTDRGGFLENIHEFDNLEFGISPKEAYDMDCHQTILLSTVLQAFEDAGIAYRGSNCGVYVAGSHEAHNTQHDDHLLSGYCATGAAPSIQANRLSFAFDLSGPSIYLDTACSGGLTAVHLARNSIMAGDCDTAVACGISIICSPNASQSFSKLGTLSPEGICRAFDDGANGYVRGEGCAVVVLKRTKDALRDNNHIYAEISGSAINANGRGTSLTLPEAKMQMATMLSAYKQSGRSPRETAYVECHGTGTSVGDPIEANGVGQVFSAGRNADTRLPIGSVKTNVGHLETGAGVVALAKAILTLDSGFIFPSLNFQKPNSKIKWDEYMIKVQTEVEQLPQSKLTKDGKFVVSVSSFGFGGANAHMVLERAPRTESKESTLAENDPMLFVTGGMTSRSLTAVTNNFVDHLGRVADVSSAALLARVISERARGHTLLSYAVGTFGSQPKFSEQKLSTSKDWNPLKLFVFSGQGPQHDEMGRKLFARFPAFRESVQQSDFVIKEHYGKSLIGDYGFFSSDRSPSITTDTEGVWPVDLVVLSIVVFQIALFDLWVAVGLTPDAVTGHSVGEIAAMYATQALSRSQAIRLAIARSRALCTLHTVGGTMAALGTSAESATELINETLLSQGISSGLWLSAENSVAAVSVSGKKELIAALVELATSKGIFARQLRVGGPYHSPLVDTCESSFRSEVDQIIGDTAGVPAVTFVSTVDGIVHPDGKGLGTQYCWDNVRKPVLFKPAIDAFLSLSQKEERNAVIVEVAPHPVLSAYLDEITKAATGAEESTTIVSSARRANKKIGETRETPVEVSQFLDAAGRLLCAGIRDLNICKLQGLDPIDAELGYNTGKLPGFPLQSITHEFSEDPVSKHRRLGAATKPLSAPLFRMSPQTHSWTQGHEIRGAIVVPAAAYLEAAFESGARTVKNVKIHRALVLSDDTPPKYVGFRPTGVPNHWTFKSASKINVDEAGVILDTLHASGEAYPEPSSNGPKDAADHMGNSDFLKDFDLSMSADKFFKKINGTGASYTREFGMISHLMASTKRERDFLCYVDPLPDLWTTKESRGMSIHPGLLDSLLLATWMYSFSFEDESKFIKDTYMPSGFDEVSLIASPEELRNAKRYMTHFITLETNELTTKHNMTLFDRDTGKTLVIIRGLHSPRVKEGAQEKVAYTEVWEPRWLDVEPAPLSLKEDAQGVDELELAPATDAAVAMENVQKLYADESVRTPLADSAAAYVMDILTKAATTRKVIRVLEVYTHSKKLRLASVAPFAAKLGMHLEVVPLNLAKCKADTAEYAAGPFSVAAAAHDAERVRPASFDVVLGVDVLRSSVSAADACVELKDLLVQGGLMALFEFNKNVENVLPLDDVPDGETSAFDLHSVITARRTTPWLKTLERSSFASSWTIPSRHSGSSAASLHSRDASMSDGGTQTPGTPPTEANESPQMSSSSQLASSLEIKTTDAIRMFDASTVVYNNKPGTETQLVRALRGLGTDVAGKLWVLCEDDADGWRGMALAGTIENEFPSIKAYGVAFGTEMDMAVRDLVLEQLISCEPTGAVEPFTIIRDNHTLQRRIVQAPSIKVKESNAPWVLDLDQRHPTASVEALVPHKYHAPPLQDDEVLVATAAVALNFKNVLSATGLLPPHDQLSEFAGTVIETGAKVQRFRRGDRVMGSSNLNREGTRAIAGELALTRVPDNMSLQEAAAFPIAYGTVYHGLVELAKIDKGDAILIPAAAGGVGLSAIQIAQRRGASIFCTVSSQEKKDYLHNNFGIPYANMSNSRSISEWVGASKKWLKSLGKAGFDVVLNSLQGASLQAGLESLAHLGRFVDISKRDHLAGTPMTMRHFSKAISYHAIELGLLAFQYPERMSALMDKVTEEHAQQPFHHLIGHNFVGADGLIEAYLLMESGKHIGKIVVDLTEACKEDAKASMLPPKPLFDPKKSYVLVGGCGGLGPRLAIMMITNGARNIVLTGRRGKLDLVEIRALKTLASDKMYPGVTFCTEAADALNEDDMRRVFAKATSMGPLGGVFLMAVVLADDQFLNMDEAKFKRVTDSKIGALKVVQNLIDVPALDFLFLFSSTAALYFNPGQANYNAAQNYFNRLATEHENIISFAVPAISDVGVFAQLLEAKGNTSATKSMLALACTSRELCERILDSLSRTAMSQPVSYYIPGNLDWTTGYKIAESCRTSFSHLAEHVDEDDVVNDGEGQADPVAALLSKLLNLDAEAIDDTAFLSSLGLDSLSASKLSSMLNAEFGVKMTQLQLLGPVSMGALRSVVAEATSGSVEADVEAIVAVDYAPDVDRLDQEAKVGETVEPFDVSKIEPSNDKLRVLVTGGTGYLGSTVLATILEKLPKANVTALVNDATPEQGAKRLHAVFTKNKLDSAPLARVSVVNGNVTKQHLGLSQNEWDRLAEDVDLIVQAHGKADHMGGYQSLVSVNTYSTSQILKLAATAKPKALCYMGSTNMWITALDGSTDAGVVREDYDLQQLSKGLQGGYQQSKWVSEMMINRARERGQTALIVRPGTLGGKADQATIGQAQDSFMARFVAGCAQFGYAPTSKSNFSETPVDWFGTVFGRLLISPKAWTSHPTYHIKSPHGLVTQDAKGKSDAWEWIPYEEWAPRFKAYVDTEEGKDNALAPLIGYFDKLVSMPDFDMSCTQEVLGSDFVECPKTVTI